MIVPVILSGGAGTRLWPLSRELYPKQLLPLVSEKTMLQETVARLDGLEDVNSPLVVCNEAHRFMVAEQLRQMDIGSAGIMLEPCGRNTAPAVAVAALQALQVDEDPVLLVLPADHVILNVPEFQSKVKVGAELAAQGKLVTFGIVPDHPETGYGYIRGDQERPLLDSQSAFAVASFVEKPGRETAESYLASGDYYWNSGMFMFRASNYLAELEKFNLEMIEACRNAMSMLKKDLDFLRLDAEAFAACPSDSIDYAVMEKTAAAAVIPLSAGWSDVGSWSALWQVKEQDHEGNVLQGEVLPKG